MARVVTTDLRPVAGPRYGRHAREEQRQNPTIHFRVPARPRTRLTNFMILKVFLSFASYIEQKNFAIFEHDLAIRRPAGEKPRLGAVLGIVCERRYFFDFRSQGAPQVKTRAFLLIPMLLACSGPDAPVEIATGEPTEESVAGESVDGAGTAVGSGLEETADEVLLDRASQAFFGDLPEILERRFIRVLVSYSKSNFFHDGGTVRGFEVKLLQAWEKDLNKGAKTYERVRLVFIPTPFDRLLEDLRQGRGDIAAAGLTATAERADRVAFTEPYIPNVQEVVVLNRAIADVAGLSRVKELSGRQVVVRSGSSYVENLEGLNDRLKSSGVLPIDILEADPRLVTEDLLEMVNAGAVEITVADHHIAEAWAEVLPEIVVRKDLAIHSGGDIAWAVRQKSPELLDALNEFIGEHRKGSLLGNILFNRYHSGSKWIANPISPAELAKLEQLIALFQKYAEQYGFDWLALAAQAYQESGLDQSRKSGAGAVGVMQLLPSTAADKSVNIADIHLLENNIHAGAKYLAFLRDRYFSDAAMEPAARVDFAWAAYNAGPARVRGLRKKAADRGLDPNRWFFNVEKIAAEEIGRETVDYVANINKYYLAYRMQYESAQARQAVKEAARGS